MKKKSVCIIFASFGIILSCVFGLGASQNVEIPEGLISYKYAVWAFVLGGLSALSLPLGSLFGVALKPNPRITASLTAFGGGALLAALSVELVAPTVMTKGSHGDVVTNILVLIAGCVLGGIIFVLFDGLLNSKGGYLRKVATTITYLNSMKRKRLRKMIYRLGHIEFFRSIPVEQIHNIVGLIRQVHFNPSDRIFGEGDEGDRMFFIESGEVGLTVKGKEFKTVGPGEVLGEISLITGATRTASATAKSDVVAFELLKEDFDKVARASAEVRSAIERIANKRLEEMDHYKEINEEGERWVESAASELHHGDALPTKRDIEIAVKSHGGAPLSIWLGIFLDGIPESFVIGAGFLIILTNKVAHGVPSFTDIIPYTLIAGLFLSNFPEAMSSSIGMKEQGWKTGKILLLWVSLMIMTAVGAVVGYYVGAEVSHTFEIFIEGLAAGAMLTMIAQTMIPEAVHLGGANVVGLSTLAGFLGAIAFKVLEK